MKIAFFSTQAYDKKFFTKHNKKTGFELEFFEASLNEQTVKLLNDAQVVCLFVNDKVDAQILKQLKKKGVSIIALRCAGFNNIDLHTAKDLDIKVCRVPSYSPEAVAEHAVAIILTLNRKTHKAYNRVREQNFSLNGLLGFDLYNKTVGVIGTGNIGSAFCRIMLGFGCKVLAFDLDEDKNLAEKGVTYVQLPDLLAQSDIISLHVPLNDRTRHLINDTTIEQMKKGMMIINTSRGGLVDTKSVITALKKGSISYLGIDVYEQEENLFFKDLSTDIIQDDLIQRLMSFPNVLVTAHQAFFTKEAMDEIANTTLQNVQQLAEKQNASLPGMLV